MKLARKLTKEQGRAYHLKRTYGLTPEQYSAILEAQGNACAICQRPATEFDKALSVDHSHVTGQIRGLACFKCNKFLIGSHEDPTLLRRVADYIEQGTGLFVPAAMVKPKRRRRRRRK